MLRSLLALLGYLALAVTLTWPLARDLGGQLPGDPAGDTCVYVWNIWHVSHEVHNGRSPLKTERIFAATGTADLSQHNPTLAPAIAAASFVEHFGVVTPFNVVYLGLLAGCGFGVYLLSHYLTRRPVESWLAGALTAASPCVLARSTEHLSLMALGVIPVFIYAWLRMLDAQAWIWAVTAGVLMAVAAYCDPYLAIYCAMLAALLLAAHLVRVTTTHRPFIGFGGDRLRILDGLLVALAAVVVSILATGGWQATVLGVRVVAHTLYTPVLAITLLTALRLTWWKHPRLDLVAGMRVWRLAGLVTTSAVTGIVVLLPWLLALAERISAGRMAAPPTYWRSSPPGVDLAAFVAPSALHPLWGEPVRNWLERLHPAGFAEFTPSLSLAAFLLIAAAVVARLRLPRRWMLVTLASMACALGPFVHVWGVNTYIPGPWALLRYVPIIEWARSPSRFALVAAIGVGVLCAHALVALRDRLRPDARRALVAVVVLVAAVEFWPAARPLHAVSIPSIIDTIAADPNPAATVLELPVGMRDGTSSMGDFSARTQYFQTWHGKRLIGGYLSRISERRKEAARDMPILSALLTLSEGGRLDDAHRRRAMGRREIFLGRTGLRYVVIDTKRCSPALRRFADELLELEPLAADQGYELYRVTPAAERRIQPVTSSAQIQGTPVLR